MTQVLRLYPGSTQARARLLKYNIDADTIVPTLELSPKSVASYVGEYRFQDELTKVAFQNGKLMAISSFGKCELRALTLAKFYCVDIEVALQFRRDSHGRVVGATAQWQDHEEYRKVK